MPDFGQTRIVCVELGEDWRGTPDDLQCLTDLDQQYFRLIGSAVDDAISAARTCYSSRVIDSDELALLNDQRQAWSACWCSRTFRSIWKQTRLLPWRKRYVERWTTLSYRFGLSLTALELKALPCWPSGDMEGERFTRSRTLTCSSSSKTKSTKLW